MLRTQHSPHVPVISRLRLAGAWCAAIGFATLVAACGATVSGSPQGTPSASTTAASSSTPSRPAATSRAEASSAPATSPPSPAASFGCAGATVAPIVTCLEAALSGYWSGQLNDVVDQPIVLAPAVAAVPAACRGGLELGTAFTCTSDGKLYVTSKFLRLIIENFPGGDLGYALAGLQAHEMGHVVQYAVKQPGAENRSRTPAQSRVFEQQADCLSGVWAHDQAAKGALNGAHFESVDFELMSLISSNPEILTHGTPTARRAAVHVGLVGGRPRACELATFH
ncbi:MAG: hypothetical protein DLM58_02655 [Pseudonocardiales bacterium]|nr:MAG: hypothetical protein DLM58_02655 [Pseudonocardiales bacterium]